MNTRRFLWIFLVGAAILIGFISYTLGTKQQQKVAQSEVKNVVIEETPLAVATSTQITPPNVQKAKPILPVSVENNTNNDALSQFKNITSWTINEEAVLWKNYYTITQKMNDQLRTYPDGQMITMSKLFNSDSSEYKNTVDVIYATLAQNGWKLIVEPSEVGYYAQYLFEKNKRPLIFSVGEFLEGKFGVQIQFLK